MELIKSTTTTNTTTEQPRESNSESVPEYDEEEEDRSEPESYDSNNHRISPKSIQPDEEVIRYQPNIGSEDYYDYEDEDDKQYEKQIKSSEEESVKSNNDIITEEEEFKSKNLFEYKTEEAVENNSIDSKQQQQVPPKTYGKICIVKGSELVCQNAETESTSTTTTTTAVPPSEEPTSVDDNCIKEAKEHVWTFKIEIEISEKIFKQTEKLIRMIAYYVNFSIRLWNQKWTPTKKEFFQTTVFTLCNCR